MSDTKNLNVEGAVVTPPEEKLPTYKVVPETDTEYKPVPNSNMVKENGDNCKDGADEKMLSPKGDSVDVKIIRGEQQNGDAKIDIMEIRQAFTGLTKEELLKFSNDPFWVRLRWIMFVGFWLLWVGMLAGAIIIILGAPKCAPPPPKTWYQDGPLLEASPSKNDPETQWNLTTLLEKLPTLSDLKIKGLFISESMLPGEDSYSVLSSEPTEMDTLKTLTDQAKEKNIKLIVDLTANNVAKSNDWFTKSEKGEHPYKDYFVWANSKTGGEENQPPNGWMSVADKPAWTFSPARNQFYLHQLDDNSPDLNFRNPDVVKEFEKVLQFWIKNGVSGVRLMNAKHLLVDPSFGDEDFSKKPSVDLTKYDSLTHTRTTFQNGLGALLLKWKNVVKADVDDGLFMLNDFLYSTEALKVNGTIVVDLPRASKIMDQASRSAKIPTAKEFADSLRNAFTIRLGDAWPSWKFSSVDNLWTSEFRIMSMLLPGSPVITLDQAIDPTANATEPLEEYDHLVTMRNLPSVKYGGFETTLLSNDTIFGFTRLKSGNPGVIVLFNPGDATIRANTTIIDGVPQKVTVNLLSANYNEEGVTVKTKLDSDNIPMSPKSVMVLTYVPDKK